MSDGRFRTQPLEPRFWSKVEKTDECWLWRGTTRAGYGSIRVNGRQQSAHRVSYEMHVGPVPAGQFIMHNCDQPLCVRPDHLAPATHEENMADMVAKGRSNVGSRNPSARLTEEDAIAIRAAHATGRFSYSDLGRMFGVDNTTARRVAVGTAWRDSEAPKCVPGHVGVSACGECGWRAPKPDACMLALEALRELPLPSQETLAAVDDDDLSGSRPCHLRTTIAQVRSIHDAIAALEGK